MYLYLLSVFEDTVCSVSLLKHSLTAFFSSLCRSSSISGVSWWTRSRQPRTLGSARLWAPWRAQPPHPPAPHPILHPLQRKAPPRWSSASLLPSAGCTLELRNTRWRNKHRRNAVFLFPPVAEQGSPASWTANSWKDERRTGRRGSATGLYRNVYISVNLKRCWLEA